MKIRCPECHAITYVSKLRCPFAPENLRVCESCKKEIFLSGSTEYFDENDEKVEGPDDDYGA